MSVAMQRNVLELTDTELLLKTSVKKYNQKKSTALKIDSYKLENLYIYLHHGLIVNHGVSNLNGSRHHNTMSHVCHVLFPFLFQSKAELN